MSQKLRKKSELKLLLTTTRLSFTGTGCISLPPATKLGQGYIFTGVCDSVHRGGLPQCMLGYHTPRTRHPPAQSMLGNTVNARAVRILLECNLVDKYLYKPPRQRLLVHGCTFLWLFLNQSLRKIPVNQHLLTEDKIAKIV